MSGGTTRCCIAAAVALSLAVSAITVVGVNETSAAAGVRAEWCERPLPSEPSPNPWPATKRMLAPPGASEIRVCRYRKDHFVRAVLLTGPNIRKLIGSVDALVRHHEKPGFTTCFFYENPIVAHLAYRNGHSVAIYDPTSCPSAGNGNMTLRWPPQALGHLTKLLKHLTAR